jgi:AcrR family transcriptional regulator
VKPGSVKTQLVADGRVLRGERSRDAIIDALLELIQEEHPQPTAREVAERAGVQPRTVFRHFQDMAGLNAELSARLSAELKPILLGADYTGSLEQRVATVVRVRGEIFERLTPFLHVSRTHRLRFEFVRADHKAMVLELRQNLQSVFPELRGVVQPSSAMLELVFSFEAWDRLRSDQGLSAARARRAVEFAALALLREAELL